MALRLSISVNMGKMKNIYDFLIYFLFLIIALFRNKVNVYLQNFCGYCAVLPEQFLTVAKNCRIVYKKEKTNTAGRAVP